MVKHEIKKITHYEYWPWWVYYFPLMPLYLWYSLKAKSLLYFTTVNPNMHFGGLFDYSKFDLQSKLPAHSRPKHQFVPKEGRENFQPELSFPFIAKPDAGERGKNVQVIHNQELLNKYLKFYDKEILLQEFVDLPLEFALFYIKFPNEKKGKIVSITAKKFLTFKGDGKTSLREFIESDSRAYFNKSYLYMKYHNQQELVLPKGEEMLLEPIGNHNRGTYFYDASQLVTEAMEDKLNNTLVHIDEYYYGRLDVKTNSIADLQNGEFIILELNGANSEATHVYDKKYNLLSSYREVARHLKYQYLIASTNMKRGIKPTKVSVFLSEFYSYLKDQRKY